jgi:DNA-binding IclR family transcriptional regulator
MGSSVSGVGVLDKAVVVLGALEGGPRSLAELVAATGLSRATTHRLAVALEVHGLAGRDLEGRFVLGPRLVALGEAAVGALPLADVAQAALAALRDATGESVQLYVRQGDRRVCVAALESPHGLRTIVPMGAALPLADGGSAGRILAGDPGVEGDAWVESVEEREPGVASVSAPVRDADGAVVAAVGVSGPVERTTRHPGERYGAAVAEAARAVERAAGLAGTAPGRR